MKLSKKVLSVVLALIMAFSTFAVALSATAAESPKPEYTENVTEEDVSLLLNDADTLLSGMLNGSLFETLCKTITTSDPINLLFPSLGYIDTWIEKYPVESMREYFSKLADYDTYNAETEMAQGDEGFVPDGKIDMARDDIADSFTRFFAEYPFPCEGIEDFRVKANGFLDFIFHNMQMNLLDVAMPEIMNGIRDFQAGFDYLCAALGIEQKKSAVSMVSGSGLGLKFDYDGATKYSNNIVNALFPDLAENIVKIIQALVSENEGPLVYSGLMKIIDGLEKIGNGLGGDLKSTLDKICGIVRSLPVIVDEEGNNARIDLQAAIPFAIEAANFDNLISITFDKTLFEESYDYADHPKPEKKSLALIFLPMADDLAKVASAESPADAVEFIIDYLYNTVLVNKYNNKNLYRVLQTTNLPFLSADVKKTILNIIDPKDDVKYVPMPKDELLTMALSLVGEMAGHHVELEDLSDQAATCVKTGWDKECWHCSGCDLYFLKSDYPSQEKAMYAAKDTAVPAPEKVGAFGAHVFGDVVAAKVPTYFKEGNKAYKPCTKCRKNFAPDAKEDAADEDAIDIVLAKVEGTLGSISKDTEIDPLDLLMLQRHLAESQKLDDVQKALADVNGDEIIDTQDLLAIKQFLVGKIKAFDEVQKVNQ